MGFSCCVMVVVYSKGIGSDTVLMTRNSEGLGGYGVGVCYCYFFGNGVCLVGCFAVDY